MDSCSVQNLLLLHLIVQLLDQTGDWVTSLIDMVHGNLQALRIPFRHWQA